MQSAFHMKELTVDGGRLMGALRGLRRLARLQDSAKTAFPRCAHLVPALVRRVGAVLPHYRQLVGVCLRRAGALSGVSGRAHGHAQPGRARDLQVFAARVVLPDQRDVRLGRRCACIIQARVRA